MGHDSSSTPDAEPLSRKQLRARALAALRDACGVKQNVLAKKMDIYPSTLSNHETGTKSPTADNLEKFLNGLNLPDRALAVAEQFVEHIETLRHHNRSMSDAKPARRSSGPSMLGEPIVPYGEPEPEHPKKTAEKLVEGIQEIVDDRLEKWFPRRWKPGDS